MGSEPKKDLIKGEEKRRSGPKTHLVDCLPNNIEEEELPRVREASRLERPVRLWRLVGEDLCVDVQRAGCSSPGISLMQGG